MAARARVEDFETIENINPNPATVPSNAVIKTTDKNPASGWIEPRANPKTRYDR